MAALLLTRGYRPPAAVADALITLSTKNVVKSPGTGTPNQLLFTNY